MARVSQVCSPRLSQANLEQRNLEAFYFVSLVMDGKARFEWRGGFKKRMKNERARKMIAGS